MKNLIAFFEIPAADFNRAVDFYATVMGFDLSVFECETEKMACITSQGETVGAISYAADFRPSADGVLISFHCTDIGHTLARAQQQGGQTVIPKTKIEVEGKGWFAVFADSEGNHIGLYSEQ